MSTKELALVSDNTILIESLSDILGSHGIRVSVVGKEKVAAPVRLTCDVVIFDVENNQNYPSTFFSLLSKRISKAVVIDRNADTLEIYCRQTLEPANLENLLQVIGT